jgi:hypothetical protein
MNPLFGILGALLTFGVIQVWPVAKGLAQQKTPLDLRPVNILGITLIIGVFIAAGAAAGWLGDPSSSTAAFLHGVGWQGVFGSAVQSGATALRQSPP